MSWSTDGVLSLFWWARSVRVSVVGVEVGLFVALSMIAPANPTAESARVTSCQMVMTLGLIRLFVPSFVAMTFVTAACRVEMQTHQRACFFPGGFV